jgi:hypothetical protein
MQVLKFEQLKKEIVALSNEQRIDLMFMIANLLKKENSTDAQYSLLDLDGLGKEMWQKSQTDTYIENLRTEWE